MYRLYSRKYENMQKAPAEKTYLSSIAEMCGSSM
jgi:hypothetical protein